MLYFIFCIKMGRSENEFYYSNIRKVIKMIEIYTGSNGARETNIEDFPIANSMKDIL